LSLLCGVAVAGAASSAIQRFDFAGQPALGTYAWLEAGGFLLKHDAMDRDKILLSQSDGALHLQVVKPAFGFIVHEQDVPDARRLRLHWGVSEYPEGASYEQGIDDEAVMLYVFFGHERLPSGSLLVPDSPYFIGFYLCPPGVDVLEKPYVGRHFKKTGRFVCVDHAGAGRAVVTEIDLREEFRKSFGLAEVPSVSGISIEIDTTEAKNDGKAAAFLSRIEFLE
jgi:hypothetical protein